MIKIPTRIKQLLFIMLAVVFGFLLLHLLFPLPTEPSWSTIIKDDRGEVVHAFLSLDDKWRMKTELHEISPQLQKAIIHKEDRYFYYHFGINPLAVLRAGWNNLGAGKRTSGASTITMQVARAMEPKSRSWWNKLREAFRALQLELTFTKQEILQQYLNRVPYGGNIEGVKSAAVLYFRKNPDHLSIAEITALSVIPNRPNSLIIGRHNEAILEERNKWLKRFKQDRLFSNEAIADALDEPLTAFRNPAPKLIPHLAHKLKKTNRAALETYINMASQLKVEQLVSSYIQPLKQVLIHNAAVIVLDNASGRVISYIGSADFNDKTDGGQVNGAAAIRQPGSTLKPFIYALAIDAGKTTPKSSVLDAAANYNGYAPENYDLKFNGAVTMEYALDHSLNIPAVRTLAVIGKDRLIDGLASAGFQQIQKDRAKLGLSMALGGCGTTLEELTGLYRAFSREGRFQRPVYWKGDTSNRFTQLVSEPAAFMINQVLSKVNRPDFPLSWQSTEKLPKIAWKTGTSYGRRDAWSIGYNQRYTIGVWVGNFSGASNARISGAEIATPLLFRLFNTLDYDAEQNWFQAPENCAIRKLCAVSGLPPGEFCEAQVTDFYIPLVSSTQTCSHIQQIAVSADEAYSYCMHCLPASDYKKELYPVYDAALQRWMEERKMVFKKIPPHHPSCEQVFKEGAPVILSPRNGASYLMEKSNPEPLQLECQTSADVVRVFWYINDQFYKAAAAGERIFFQPDAGPVRISCTDDKGRNRNIRIDVSFFGN